ncbi:unnamed protein product, partial [Mesorhabditis belari]|uniref:Uncharacterized protein n=1 Tax=Mesorhabditis belari TaxID=2138241 RepID=A0AAF3FMY7_9BILA
MDPNVDLSWWNYLNWNITKCTKYSDDRSVSWTLPCNATHPFAFGTLCWIVTTLLFIVFLLTCCCLLYAVYVYREDNKRLKYEYAEVERNLRKQNEYFTARIHRQMEEQMKLNEKHQIRSEAAEKAAVAELAAAKTREQPQPIIIYGQPMIGGKMIPPKPLSPSKNPPITQKTLREIIPSRHAVSAQFPELPIIARNTGEAFMNSVFPDAVPRNTTA